MSKTSMERQKQVETLTAANRSLMGECQRLRARLTGIAADWRNSQRSHAEFAKTYEGDQRAGMRRVAHLANAGTYGTCAERLEELLSAGGNAPPCPHDDV